MKRIRLFYNKFETKMSTMVSDEDYEILTAYKWRILQRDGKLWARTTIEGEEVLMHRLVGLLMKEETMGENLKEALAMLGKIFHRNGNRLDNQRENLLVGGIDLSLLKEEIGVTSTGAEASDIEDGNIDSLRELL